MTIRLRVSGEPDEIAALIAELRGRYDVAGGEHAYPNRGAFGVRVYLEIRPRPHTQPMPSTNPESRTR